MKYDDTATDVLDERPRCDLCAERLEQRGRPRSEARLAAIDGKTRFGPWAYMCVPCFENHGVGLGLGKGQRLLIDPPESA